MGSASIGAGISSVTYSVQCAVTGDNWDATDWAANVGIGAVSSIGSIGIGMAVGRGVGILAASAVSFSNRTILTVGAGIVAGAVTDSTVNVLSTLAYNGITGASLSSGLGASAIAGGLSGAAGGFFGGLIGYFGELRGNTRLRSASQKRLFSNAPNFNGAEDYTRMLGGNPRHLGGFTGIWNMVDGELSIGNYNTRPPQIGSAHEFLATEIYRGRPDMVAREGHDGEEFPNCFPNIRGFSIQKTDPGNAAVGFNSQSLNGPLKTGPADLRDPNMRMKILTGLRVSGIGVSFTDKALNRGITKTERILTLFLKNPGGLF